jgi:hypothetical protein
VKPGSAVIRFVAVEYVGRKEMLPLLLMFPNGSKLNVCAQGVPQFTLVMRIISSYP